MLIAHSPTSGHYPNDGVIASKYSVSGFIDFIVVPTLTTCGDMIKNVLINSPTPMKDDCPWRAELGVNRTNWQKKVTEFFTAELFSRNIYDFSCHV